DPRALSSVANPGTRVAACLYAVAGFTANVNLTDGKTHEVAVYLVDWDGQGRSEQVSVLDAATGAVLDSRTVMAFSGGEYLAWNVSGHVLIKVSSTSSLNAVASAFFFGPPGSGAPAATATFVQADTTTQGNWKAGYGADGYSLAGDAGRLPAYAQLNLT